MPDGEGWIGPFVTYDSVPPKRFESPLPKANPIPKGIAAANRSTITAGGPVAVVGSVSVKGSGSRSADASNGDSDPGVDVTRIDDLVDLKVRMDADSSTGSAVATRSTMLAKALEQASALKAAATDPSTDREELTGRINRLVEVIDRIDNVSGRALRDIADVEAALGDARASQLSESERRRLREAVDSLEDELHVAV